MSPTQLLIQYFYESLLYTDRSLIDAASGGALVNPPRYLEIDRKDGRKFSTIWHKGGYTYSSSKWGKYLINSTTNIWINFGYSTVGYSIQRQNWNLRHISIDNEYSHLPPFNFITSNIVCKYWQFKLPKTIQKKLFQNQLFNLKYTIDYFV